jgi:hypothetical protein
MKMNLNADDLKTLGSMVNNLDKLAAAFNGTVKHATESGQVVSLDLVYDHNSARHYLTLPNAG